MAKMIDEWKPVCDADKEYIGVVKEVLVKSPKLCVFTASTQLGDLKFTIVRKFLGLAAKVEPGANVSIKGQLQLRVYTDKRGIKNYDNVIYVVEM